MFSLVYLGFCAIDICELGWDLMFLCVMADILFNNCDCYRN